MGSRWQRDERGEFDTFDFVLGLIMIAWIIVAFLNGQRAHDERVERYRACSHAENVTVCVRAAK